MLLNVLNKKNKELRLIAHTLVYTCARPILLNSNLFGRCLFLKINWFSQIKKYFTIIWNFRSVQTFSPFCVSFLVLNVSLLLCVCGVRFTRCVVQMHFLHIIKMQPRKKSLAVNNMQLHYCEPRKEERGGRKKPNHFFPSDCLHLMAPFRPSTHPYFTPLCFYLSDCGKSKI